MKTTKIAINYYPTRNIVSIAETLKSLPSVELFVWNDKAKPIFDLLDEQSLDVVFYKNEDNHNLDMLRSEFKETSIITFGEGEDQINDMLCLGADWVAMSDSKRLKEFECDISIFTDSFSPDLHSELIKFLINNYHVRLFGFQLVNCPFYLGQVSTQEKANIIKSSRCVYDLDGFTAFDAAAVKVPSVQHMSVNSKFKSADDVSSLSSELKILLSTDFEKAQQEYCDTVHELAVQQNFHTILNSVFIKNGLIELAEQTEKALQEIISK